MKKTILYAICLLTLIGMLACGDDDVKSSNKQGSIYGVVTDKATGEPLKSAGVELLPLGLKTVTGSEGQFEFVNLDAGSYTLIASKTNYSDSEGTKIEVKKGQSSKCDFQLELLPPALKIVDNSGNEITELTFDNSAADVSRSFNIFNDSPEKLEWEITASAEWIKSFSKTQGILSPGKTQSIILTIDREKLSGGAESTKIHITSDNGGKQITVKVISDAKTLVKLNTLAVSDIHLESAVLNGEITDTGSPTYTERGFVYATSSMPTIETTIKKLTVAVTKENKYSYKVTGLQEGKTYYVRAYAINKTGVAYSTNEVTFNTKRINPSVKTNAVSNITGTSAQMNGTIVSVGEPAYTEKGFVLGTLPGPTLDDATKYSVTGSGIGDFSRSVTNLTNGKTYYVRAYAKTSKDVAYGEVVSFTAENPKYISLKDLGIMVQTEDLGNADWDSADDMASNSRIGGFSDWRLPTRAELLMIYQHKTTIGGFENAKYWTSELDIGAYILNYYIDFSNGEINSCSRFNQLNVRAVRSIK